VPQIHVTRLQIVTDDGLGFTPSFSTTPSSLFDNRVEEALTNKGINQQKTEAGAYEQEM
jgi:hypothetical protein